MDITTATTYLVALADGIDPATGEVFASDSVYQRPDTVRALMTVLRELEQRGSGRPREPDPQAPNVGKPWSKTDDDALVEAFRGGEGLSGLCTRFGRKPGGIRARCQHLGLVENGRELR